jgi:hypothetical protein
MQWEEEKRIVDEPVALEDAGDPYNFNEGPVQKDRAAQCTLEAMTWAKVVYLQDGAMLQDTYPDNSMYRHRVFKHPLWEEYKEKVLNPVKQADQIVPSPTLKEFAEDVSN